MNGECVRRSGNTHIIDAVLVIGQRSVGVGERFFGACETSDRAPCSVFKPLVIADAFILPCGIGVSIFPQQCLCQNAVHRGSIAACGNEHLSSFGLNLRLFSHGLFNHGLFSHRSFNLGFFNLGFFNLGFFNLGFFNLEFFNLGFFNLGLFNLGLVDHSLVDRLGFRDCFGCGFQRGFLGKCRKAQRLCHKHHCQKSSQKSGLCPLFHV